MCGCTAVRENVFQNPMRGLGFGTSIGWMSEEEAVTHIWAHYKYKTPLLFDEERIRATVGAIYSRIKKVAGSTLRQASLIGFGRMLSNLDGMQRRRYVNGTEYLVKER